MESGTKSPDGADPQSPGLAEILDLTMAFYRSRVLISAVELDVFTVLADGPRSAASLAEATGVHPRGARDFFDALTALGLLVRRDGGYENAPAAARHLDRRRDEFVGGYTRLADKMLFPTWSKLTEGLRTGRKQAPSAGFFDGDADRHRGFLAAMDAVNSEVSRNLVEAFDWSRVTQVVDLGGARGNVAAALVDRHEHLAVTCYDLPWIEPFFDEHVGDRASITFQGGDFFADPLPKADVYLLGHILHCFDADQRARLLERIATNLPPGGAILVYDRITDDDRSGPVLSLLGGLNMLLTTETGSEYTRSEATALLVGAGFDAPRFTAVSPTDTVAVARKN